MLWKDLKAQNCDVMLLQESHFSGTAHPQLSFKQFLNVHYSNGPKKKGGVAILIKDSVIYKYISHYSDPEGRFLLLHCEINNAQYSILNASNLTLGAMWS